MAKYSYAHVYTKKGNLLPWLYGKGCIISDQAKDFYSKEREIQLAALFRFEGSKTFCRIKCPVNPLPVKGEFEVPSISTLSRFLNENGWSFKELLCARWFE